MSSKKPAGDKATQEKVAVNYKHVPSTCLTEERVVLKWFICIVNRGIQLIVMYHPEHHELCYQHK